MSYARETALANRSFTPALDAELVRNPWAGPLGIGWATAFVAAAVKITSPAAVRNFFRMLARKDRMLFRLGWALVFAVPVFAALGLLQPAATMNASPWIKPIKFSMSFASFAWTVSLFLMLVRIPAWQRRLARKTIAVSVTIEMLCLAAQAWRNAGPNSTAFADFLIQQGTTAMVSINTLVTIWFLVVFSRKRERIKLTDYAQIVAIRLSIWIFLLGNAIGGYMLGRGSHTVGASDSGPGLPFVNWSTIGGDLRIAHFIAIHAIQIVPVFAVILAQMTPRPSHRQRRMAVYAMAALVALAVGGTFVQAALGHPLLSIAR